MDVFTGIVRSVEKLAQMPDEYGVAVTKIVVSHAVNEIAGAEAYDEPAIRLAPTPYHKWLACRIAMEEYGHHVHFSRLARQLRVPEEKGSYLPLAQANQPILKEEEGHKNFGEACLEEMCKEPATRAEIQGRFKKWFVGSLRVFGRTGTPGNQYCLKVGLKTRDSGDVAAAYLDSIRPVMARCGLRFPQREELPLDLPPGVDLSVLAPGP